MLSKPQPVWRPKPITQDVARAALEAARDDAEQYKLCLEFATGVIQVLADRRMPARISDPTAERRMIGWLLSGRARQSDVAEIMPYDIASNARRVAYAVALSIVEVASQGRVDLAKRSARTLLLATIEEHMPEFLGPVGDELTRTPCPAVIPQRSIDVVASLGRAWSGVEEEYEQRPAMLAAGSAS